MSEHLEARLGDLLSRRVNGLTETAISADGIVRAGRKTVARRRFAAVVAAAAVILVSAAITATGRPQTTPPADRSSPPPSASTPSPSTWPTVTSGSLGLDVRSHNLVERPDGRRIGLPGAAGVLEVSRVPGGWVVMANDGDRPSLLFVPDSGAPKLIGSVGGNYAISVDGKVLVATGVGGATNVEAYQLPSLRVIRHTTFGGGSGPLVVGISGDRVVLRGAHSSSVPSSAAVWNLRTGSLHTTSTDVWVWAVSRDGRVLRRVNQPGTGGANPAVMCVDAITLTDSLPVTPSGTCVAELSQPDADGQSRREVIGSCCAQ